MKRVGISDAPACLSTNDKAFWVLGFTDCAAVAEAAVKQARIDALEEARSLVRKHVIHSSDADACAAAIESLKEAP